MQLRNMHSLYYIMEWKKYYALPRKITKYVKMQEFQYKVLHRILPTNHRLFKMKKKGIPSVESPNCRLCGQDETLTHMLLYCPKIQHIWHWLQKVVFNIMNKTVELYTKNCVLGILSRKKEIWQWNWVSLQIRHYLYLMQQKIKIPSIQGFKAVLRSTIEIVKAGHSSLQ